MIILLKTPFSYLSIPFLYRPFEIFPKFRDDNINFLEDKFEINFNVGNLEPEEITVEILDDNRVCIEVKNKKENSNEKLSQFSASGQYVLPPNEYDLSKAEAKLQSGVLIITAPRIEEDKRKNNIKKGRRISVKKLENLPKSKL